MTELDQVIKAAYTSLGKTEDVNKVYITLLRSSLFLPTLQTPENDEPFTPLYTEIDGNYFILAFDTLDRLRDWAGEAFDKMNVVELPGRDIIAGVHETVFFCLNPGTTFYKEFSPDEIIHLKKVVARIDQLKQ